MLNVHVKTTCKMSHISASKKQQIFIIEMSMLAPNFENNVTKNTK